MTRTLPVLLLALLPLLGACATDGVGGTVASTPATAASNDPFLPVDLNGTWFGVSEPLVSWEPAVALTLGFSAFGTATNAVGLTEYSFQFVPGQLEINYLSYLDLSLIHI